MSKKKLEELVQGEYRTLPTFLFSMEGAENAPQFSASVSFCGLTFHSRGRFRSLKGAQNAAADVALEALLANPDEEPMQTDAPAVPIHIQSGEIYSNLQEARKEEMLQPPGNLPSTSESDKTHMLPKSGHKDQTPSRLQIEGNNVATGTLGKRQQTEDLQQIGETASTPYFRPGHMQSGEIHSNLQEVKKEEMLQPPGSLPSTSESDKTHMLPKSGHKDQTPSRLQIEGNNVATGTLGKRQQTEGLQQIEETASTPYFRPVMMGPDKLFAYRGVDGGWHAHKKAGRLQFYCTIDGCKNKPGFFYYERRLLDLHRREKHGELALPDVKLKEPNLQTKYSRARYEREKNDDGKWLDMLSKNHKRRLENQACSKERVNNKLMLSDMVKVEIDEKMLVYDSEESRQERIRKRDEREARRSHNPIQT